MALISEFLVFKKSVVLQAYTLCWSHYVGVNCVSWCVLAGIRWGGVNAGEQADSGKSKLRTQRKVSEEEVIGGSLGPSPSILKSWKQSWDIIILNFPSQMMERCGWGRSFRFTMAAKKNFRSLSEAVLSQNKMYRIWSKTRIGWKCHFLWDKSNLKLFCYTHGIFMKKSCCLPVSSQWMFSNTSHFSLYEF